VKEMMASVDDKTKQPKWKKLDDAQILKARPDVMKSTEYARTGMPQQQDQQPTAIKSFDIVWVLRWIMSDSQGADRVFYTMGTEALLTKDEPIDSVYFHG